MKKQAVNNPARLAEAREEAKDLVLIEEIVKAWKEPREDFIRDNDVEKERKAAERLAKASAKHDDSVASGAANDEMA